MGTHVSHTTVHRFIVRSIVSPLAVFILLVGFLINTVFAQGRSTAGSEVTQYSVIINDGTALVRPARGGPAFERPVRFERDRASGRWASIVEPTASSAESARRFSYAVAVSGSRAIVGVEWENGFRGAAYVLKNDGGTWVVERRLSPADLGPYDHFGGSVAIDGDHIVVGATWHNLFSGAAYVFTQADGVWTEQQKLTASDAAPNQHFGTAVGFSEGMLTILDARTDAGGGVAYRYEKIGERWTERETTEQATNTTTTEEFLPNTIVTTGILDAARLVDRNGEAAPLLASGPPPPPASVTATDGTLEGKVEVVWSSVGLDAIVYAVYRDGALLSVVSSNETKYSDTTGDPGITYEYCLVVEDMAGQESTPVCDNGSRVIFAPSAVSASDGAYTDRVHITWVDISSINTGYSIRRNSVEIGTTPANQGYFDDTSAMPEVIYQYDVVATVTGGYNSAAMSDSGWRGVLLPPLNVNASDGQYLDRVRITWEGQDPDTTGWAIYRDDSLIAWTGVGVTTWDDTTVTFGESYTYCVSAKQDEGTVTGIRLWMPAPEGSNFVESARVCDEGGTGLAAPGDVSASDSTYDDRVRVTWTDLSKFEDGYEISRAAYGDTMVLDTTSVNATLYDDFTAEPDSTYLYLVRAISDLGGVSLQGADLGYRSVVLAPYDIKATDGAFEDRVDISWESNSTTAVLFKIFRDGTFVKSVSSADRFYRDYGGTAGQNYDYTVVALTALKAEATGLADQGRRELLKPTQAKATDEAFEDKVVISWTENSRMEDGYLVSRDDTASAVIDSFTIGPNRNSYTDYAGVPGVHYIYSVSAFDSANGTLGYSPAAQDPGYRILLAPTDVRADKGLSETKVKITWIDNSDAEDGYRIYRDSSLVGTADDNATSFVDSPDSLGQTSLYHVRAFDSYGESDADSDSGYTTILAPISVNLSDVYEDRIEITWIDQSEVEEGYKIYREGELLKTLAVPNVTSFTDSLKNPTITGTYNTPGEAHGVTIVGDYAYLADGTSGLRVFDITNPANPAPLGSWDTPTNALCVAIAGNYAYVADQYTGLQVIDISNPLSLSFVGEYDTPDYAQGVAVAGNYAYVADGTSGLQIIDITNPAAPTSLSSYDTPGWAWNVTIVGDYAYVADRYSGLQVIDISNPASPALIGSCDTPGEARDVKVDGDYAYVGDGISGLQVIDISNLASPTIVGSYDTPNGPSIVDLAAGYAYLADDASLRVINVTDPRNPRFAASLQTPGRAYGLDVAGDYVYVADDLAGLHVISLPLWYPGNTYDYCVRAYRGGVASETKCDGGIIPIVGTTVLTTELFSKLVANEVNLDDFFGFSSSINGDQAIIGAYWTDSRRGAAYVFERDGAGDWIEVQRLVASDRAPLDRFGFSVSISGDWAIVGAHGNAAGKAYIFERDAAGDWIETTILTADDAASGDQFGGAVSISGDRAIVGAPRDDDNGTDSGSAYIFKHLGVTWSQTQKLTASDGAENDAFGLSVSISGDSLSGHRAIVGAHEDDDRGAGSGSAYIFERDPGDAPTFNPPQKLLASDGSQGDHFAYSVSIDDDRAIVGAYGDADNGIGSGSAYIFERDAGGVWSQAQKLVASDGATGDHFGWSVSTSGNRAIVGSIYDEDKGASSGSAYIFEPDAGGFWSQTQKLVAGDGAIADLFGWSVSISGNTGVIGAYLDSDRGRESGAAFVVDLVTRPYAVAASDGTLDSRIRVTWDDRSLTEKGFRVYRDGEPIANVEPNVEVYEDFDAEPGRTYEYGVTTLSSGLSDEVLPAFDFGWRPANGGITGRISSVAGLPTRGVSVAIEPLPVKALLMDGAGGYVTVRDATGALNFGAESSFTIEAWIKYQENGGAGSGDGTVLVKAEPGGSATRYPFALGNMRGSGEPGRLRFSMSSDATTVSVNSDNTGYNDNAWHHVACVHDAAQDEIKIYVDGELHGKTPYASLGSIANTESMSLGVGRTVGTWFGGQIDELRIWSVARDSVEIRGSMYQQLVGDEEGLLSYWPLDGRGPDVMTDATTSAHYGLFHGGVYWTEDIAPLDIFPVTDVQGSYVSKDLYYGTGATFQVRPFEGSRQFDPTYRMITLSTESPVENQVDFTDVSSFTVSGTIRYAGTECAAADIPVLVDSQPAGATDKKGKFAVSADLGEHSIRPSSDGHTFGPDSLIFFVDDDVSLNDSTGVAFTDSTTRTLAGHLGGGCGRAVGDITITVRSENDCLLETYAYPSGDSAYSVQLPPQSYLVSASVDPQTIPAGLSKSDVVQYFQNLGVRMAELDSLDVTMDFVYRAPLQVAIRGFDEYVETCPGPLTFEDRTLPDSLPVIPQLKVVVCTLQVYEDYGSGEVCPLDSGTVVVYDEIFDRQNDPFELVVRDGAAVCSTYTSTPSLIVGRTDEQGNDRSFQKSIRAVVNVEGRSPADATQWVLVTGHVAPEGADFVTATTDVPLYILRDPPGDNSSAFLEQGYTSRTRMAWDRTMWKIGGGVDINIAWGADLEFFVGFGAGILWGIETKYEFDSKNMLGNIGATEYWTDITTTTKKTFSTSSNSLYVGEEGDVYVGAGLNFIFSEVGVIDVDGCSVTKSTSIGFQPKAIKTMYSYTQRYIETVLIPEFDAKIAYYQAKAEADSVSLFEQKRAQWVANVAHNDSLKAAASVIRNVSFSAGADFTYTQTSDTTNAYTRTNTFYWDSDNNLSGFSLDTQFADFGFDILAEVHNEDLSNFVDSTHTETGVVSYTLSDDDIGDHFTVDVKNDGIYPSPVFDALAGASSCPYEPWPDPETGEARMLPRDKAGLLITPEARIDVPSGEPAAFTLNLLNESPMDESRLYVLRMLTASNPYGAIVKVGGVPVSTGTQQYFIDAGQAQQATLTVERGPTRYNYQNLALILYPPCEYEAWENGSSLQQADTVFFSVNFDAPCSDITMLLPKSGWVYDKSDQDSSRTIDLLLTGYELDIGEDGGTIQDVGVQYRQLGAGREGPGPWTVCAVVANPDSGETLIAWLPSDSLEDGVYELRAYTHCDAGYGYSEAATGVIERHGPVVFGAPEPTDGELSLGEEIRVTFNELIDCQSIDPDSVTLTYMDGPNVGTLISLETVCDERTIVITPTASPNEMEGRLIEARVAAVRDKAGNPMVRPVTWAFAYRMSQFTWSQLNLTADVPYRDPGTVTADLVNGTEAPVEFTVTDWPGAWLDSVNPSTGTIPPGGQQSVSFAVRDTTMGTYEGEVTATAADESQGIAIFDLHVTVSCHEPVWVVDASHYEHTMTVVAAVDIADTLSTDANDRVAAFVGNQLRGVANVMYVGGVVDQYLAFLTVYSNRVDGEMVRFQVWDDSNCKRYNATEESHPFVANGSFGSASMPDTLTATEIAGVGALSIACNEGWTWFSTDMQSIPMSVDSVLADLTPADGDLIKSQFAFSQFADTAWVGALTDLDNVSSYMLRLSGPGTIVHMGTAVPISTPVPVQQGWNWIGYLPQGPIDVTVALGDLDGGLAVAGDVVKSQTGFAEYLGGVWYGSLSVMEPGQGYKLYLSSAANSSFVYPLYMPASAIVATGIAPQEVEGAPVWSVNPHAYQYNMTVTAALYVEGTESIDENDMVGAFVGDECRGVARPVYVDGVWRHEVFLMVCGNEAMGEKVTLQAFDADAGLIYDVTGALAFEADKVEGTVQSPLLLMAETVHDGQADLPATYALAQNYPNPFNPSTTIAYDVPAGGGVVTLRVYDVAGRLVRTLVDGNETAGRKTVVWDGHSNTGQRVATGVYFYRMTAPGFEQTRKMVVMK